MTLKLGRNIDLGEVLIDINENDSLSDVMDFSGWRGMTQSITIDGPGTLTGTARVQVSNSMEDFDEFGNSTWFDKQSGGADILIPADGSVSILDVNFRRLRIASSGDETADRRFKVRGKEPSH